MALQPVDLTILNDLFEHMEIRGVPYIWGGKANNDLGNPGHAKNGGLGTDSINIVGLDCSGFTQFAIYRGTEGKVVVPEGSVEQRDWASTHLKLAGSYNAVNNGEGLYWSFFAPHGDRPGHTWMTRQNWTRESKGGIGIYSRPWNHPTLVRRVEATYILPSFR